MFIKYMCDCPRGSATELCFVKSEIYHFSLDDFNRCSMGNVYNGDFFAIEILFRPRKVMALFTAVPICCSYIVWQLSPQITSRSFIIYDTLYLIDPQPSYGLYFDIQLRMVVIFCFEAYATILYPVPNVIYAQSPTHTFLSVRCNLISFIWQRTW